MKLTIYLLLAAFCLQPVFGQSKSASVAFEDPASYRSYRDSIKADYSKVFGADLRKSVQADLPPIDWKQFGANEARPMSIVWSADGSSLYASNGSAIYISEDQGVSWTEFYKIPETNYLGITIQHMRFHPADTNHLYYVITFAANQSLVGLYSLNILTGENEAIRTNAKVNDYEFLSSTSTDSIVVVTSEADNTEFVWVSIDAGEYWKKVSEIDGIEQAEVISRSDGGLELLIAGYGGVFSVDFHDAWTSQIWDWKHEFRTVERGDTVAFTRSVGLFETLPGEDRLLAGARFFSHDRYEDDSYKLAKFWELDFEERFAREYTDVPWDDDTTAGEEKRRAAWDVPFVLEFDPNNTDRMWLGEGNEILFSNDGAKTWTSEPYEYRDLWIVFQMACNPLDSDHLLVTSEMNSILTHDNFETFDYFGVPGLALFDLDIHVDEEGMKTFYYADWYNEIFSEDGAGNLLVKTRLEYDIPTVSRVTADPFNKGVFFVSSGHDQGGFVHKLEEFGSTENMVFNSTSMGNVRILKANPNREDEFWFLADANFQNPEASCYRTIDGGIPGTWEKVSFGEYGYNYLEDIAFHPEDPNTVYITGSFSIGIDLVTEVLKSTDGGKNWEIFGEVNGLPRMANYINRLSVNPFNSEQVIAGSFDMPYITNDGGETWSEYPIEISGYENLDLLGFSFNKLDYTGFENVLVGLGSNNDLIISCDNAKNWISLRDGESLSSALSIRGVRTLRVGKEDPVLAIYISTMGGSLYSMEIKEEDLAWTNGDPVSVDRTWIKSENVYPNPTEGGITLTGVEGAEIRIYDETGRQIAIFHSESDTIQTDILKEQASGLYFILIMKEGQSRQEKVLLIK